MGYQDPLGREMVESVDKEGGLHLSPPPGQEVCDICLKPWREDEDWTYPCGPVALAHPVFTNSDDPWAVCQGCHELIQADDWEGLLERALLKQREKPPPNPEFVQAPMWLHRASLTHNLAAFREARNGEPYRGRPQ